MPFPPVSYGIQAPHTPQGTTHESPKLPEHMVNAMHYPPMNFMPAPRASAVHAGCDAISDLQLVTIYNQTIEGIKVILDKPSSFPVYSLPYPHKEIPGNIKFNSESYVVAEADVEPLRALIQSSEYLFKSIEQRFEQLSVPPQVPPLSQFNDSQPIDRAAACLSVETNMSAQPGQSTSAPAKRKRGEGIVNLDSSHYKPPSTFPEAQNGPSHGKNVSDFKPRKGLSYGEHVLFDLGHPKIEKISTPGQEVFYGNLATPAPKKTATIEKRAKLESLLWPTTWEAFKVAPTTIQLPDQLNKLLRAFKRTPQEVASYVDIKPFLQNFYENRDHPAFEHSHNIPDAAEHLEAWARDTEWWKINMILFHLLEAPKLCDIARRVIVRSKANTEIPDYRRNRLPPDLETLHSNYVDAIHHRNEQKSHPIRGSNDSNGMRALSAARFLCFYHHNRYGALFGGKELEIWVKEKGDNWTEIHNLLNDPDLKFNDLYKRNVTWFFAFLQGNLEEPPTWDR